MSRPPVEVSCAVIAVLLLSTAPAAAAPPPGNTVRVKLDATLQADGALRGTVVATWTGACAREARQRFAPMTPDERARALRALGAPGVAGHLEPRPAIKGIDTARDDLQTTWTLLAPRFAAPAGAGGPLRLGLPLLIPYDPKKSPAALIPYTVVHEVTIRLPAAMTASELPAAFSSVTPEAGRYVLYYDLERAGGDIVVKARRELEISGASPSRLDELMEGAAALDATSLTIVRAAGRPES